MNRKEKRIPQYNMDELLSYRDLESLAGSRYYQRNRWYLFVGQLLSVLVVIPVYIIPLKYKGLDYVCILLSAIVFTGTLVFYLVSRGSYTKKFLKRHGVRGKGRDD